MRKYKKYLGITLAYFSLFIVGFMGIFFINRIQRRMLNQFTAPSAISKKLLLGKFLVLTYNIEAKSLKNILDFAEQHNYQIRRLTINPNKRKVIAIFNPDLPNKFNTTIRKCLAFPKLSFPTANKKPQKYKKHKPANGKSINFIHVDEKDYGKT